MKYYKLNNDVYAFELDGSQDTYITDQMVLMSDEEIDQHINPEKYLGDIEKAQLKRQNMPTLTPIEFDLLLDKHDLYDVVQDLISTNRTLKIAYNRATFFSRTDLFIEQARIALALTNEQIDGMWTS